MRANQILPGVIIITSSIVHIRPKEKQTPEIVMGHHSLHIKTEKSHSLIAPGARTEKKRTRDMNGGSQSDDPPSNVACTYIVRHYLLRSTVRGDSNEIRHIKSNISAIS